MADRQRQPNEIERLIGQVRDLEQAGVFERTPVDVASLVQGDQPEKPRRLTHRLFVGLQVAAGLALVVGLVGVWRAGVSATAPPAGDSSSGADLVGVVTGGGDGQVRVLAHCFTGPSGGPLGDECRCVDFDGDQDVDLADYGAFQVAYAQSR